MFQRSEYPIAEHFLLITIMMPDGVINGHYYLSKSKHKKAD